MAQVLFDSIEKKLRSLWNKGTQTIFKEVLIGFGLAISVYLGFYLGFGIQQMDRVGQAMITIRANNATTLAPSWIYQASSSTKDYPAQTIWYAFLLVPLLVIPNLASRHHASVLTSIAFPILIVFSWLALPAATLPASLPQSYVNLCGTPKEAVVSVNQIQAFIIFEQSFVLSLITLTILTATWVSTRSIGVKRNILWNIPLIIFPLLAWYFTPSLPFLQIPGLEYSAITVPCVEVTPLGRPYVTLGGFLPSYLGPLSDALIEVGFLLFVFSTFNYLISKPTHPEIDRLVKWLRLQLSFTRKKLSKKPQ